MNYHAESAFTIEVAANEWSELALRLHHMYDSILLRRKMYLTPTTTAAGVPVLKMCSPANVTERAYPMRKVDRNVSRIIMSTFVVGAHVAFAIFHCKMSLTIAHREKPVIVTGHFHSGKASTVAHTNMCITLKVLTRCTVQRKRETHPTRCGHLGSLTPNRERSGCT